MKGDHGAGVAEPMWDDIASFIVHGKAPPIPPAPPFTTYADKQSPLWHTLGLLSPILLLGALLCLVALPAVLIWHVIANGAMSGQMVAGIGLGLLVYFNLLRFIALRF